MTISDSLPQKYHRDRNSSRLVRLTDRIAKQVITIGGIGTILVVLLVVLVLLGNVLPMFQTNHATSLARIPLSLQPSPTAPLPSNPTVIVCGVDEYAEIAWVLDSSDCITAYSVSEQRVLSRFRPEDVTSVQRLVRCASVADNDASLMAGYEDGKVRPITIEFQTQFVRTGDLGEQLAANLRDGVESVEGTVYRIMPGGLVRKQSIASVRFHPVIEFSDSGVQVVDWETPVVASGFDESQTWNWSASDGHRIAVGQTKLEVAFSGNTTQQSAIWSNVVTNLDEAPPIVGLTLGALFDQVRSVDSHGRITVWKKGEGSQLENFATHKPLTEGDFTAMTGILGRSTLVMASASGKLEGIAMSATKTGQELLSIHQFDTGIQGITSIASSPESRMVGVTNDVGRSALYYIPSNTKLVDWESESSGQFFFSASGKAAGLLSNDHVDLWEIDVPFPEASFGSFFERIWYEGYDRPQHVWQSSTGNVRGEYKFGFVPLIFGTLKATLYSMLIGAPIALMAAIFGSEFMSSKWRTRVKPVIELMASIPSVVLGFVGALVLAPLLCDHLMWGIASVVMVLFSLMLCAHLWLVIPSGIAIRLRKFRLPIIFLTIPISILVAGWMAHPFEQWLFHASAVQWLSSKEGSGWSGWFCLSLLPLALLVAWLMHGPLSGVVQSQAKRMAPLRFSLFNVGLFLVACLTTLALCALTAAILSGFGLDPRGSLLGPYQERNALLVGGILGFAIIPLIYTISEDALQSVPQHLRSASLGCGATTWQTTVRVVIPTAMSGLFSALMIGFGRAVGETMVVLMAAGNTPVMDINPMNGYRTLSATLATELPEAARGSTHYHALFLAAFLLFCFTMLANTIAEVVRMRFRKRAYQL